MKTLVLAASLLLLEGGVYSKDNLNNLESKNAWETSRNDLTERDVDLEIREEKRSKTSIIVYDKIQMTDEDVDAEITRIEEKCNELDCPCSVIKLDKVGVLEVTWQCDNHPSVNDLELDSAKETGAEDQIINANSPPPPNDEFFSLQWALRDSANDADINIAEGWAEYLSDAKGGDANGPSVVVAVIDTGIDYTHPDLKDAMWTNPDEIAGDGIDNDGNGIIDDVYGADYSRTTRGTGDPIDRNGHGTHCSGIIAATPNNRRGIAGVASFTQGKVKLMALKGLSNSGSGTLSGMLACLNYAIDKGAKISSNSWGGGIANNGIERVWDAVLRNNLDHLFIAAAGNDNKEINNRYKYMPCGLKEPNLLCVASSTKADTRSSFSNYGPEYVHVFAPGSQIASTTNNNGYAYRSGTSMACPMVSGLAALIMTMRDGMSAQEIRELIEANVRVKPQYASFVSSSGLIDVGKTIKALKGNDDDDTKRCTTINIRTQAWGNENSYVIGTCASKQRYRRYQNYEEECCLAPGDYTLECKDSWGDGWHGGYLEIDGKKYCDRFRAGRKQTVTVTWSARFEA